MRPATTTREYGTRMGENRGLGAMTPMNIRKFREAAAMFDEHTEAAMRRLVAIVENERSDDGHAIAAAKEILTRAWGQAPSFQVVQGIIQHDHKVSVDPAALQNMDAEQLAALEGTLTRLLSAPEAIEHEK